MRRLAAVAVLLLALACSSVPSGMKPGKTGEDALALAKLSCTQFDNFRAMVKVPKAKTETVLTELDGATLQAERAQQMDRFWQPLHNGMATVRRGFKKNSGEVTEAGVKLVSERCARAKRGA